MNWLKLESISDLKQITQQSFSSPVAIFKHSTRCSISSVAKMRLSSSWSLNDEVPIYYLDLLSYRDVSNLIAEQFGVPHQSPQLLVIKNGDCIYNNSHLSISVKDVRQILEIKD